MELLGFFETPRFTKRVAELLDEESYIALQIALCERPDAGAVIGRSGGWRKIRWRAQGRGKRGGVRVIYYWWTERGEIYLGDIYPKNEKQNLSSREIEDLRRLIE